jgi:hypothetical protein
MVLPSLVLLQGGVSPACVLDELRVAVTTVRVAKNLTTEGSGYKRTYFCAITVRITISAIVSTLLLVDED